MLGQQDCKVLLELFLASDKYKDREVYAKLFVRYWAITVTGKSLPIVDNQLPWCFQ